jgi:hypothetical protein
VCSIYLYHRALFYCLLLFVIENMAVLLRAAAAATTTSVGVLDGGDDGSGQRVIYG